MNTKDLQKKLNKQNRCYRMFSELKENQPFLWGVTLAIKISPAMAILLLSRKKMRIKPSEFVELPKRIIVTGKAGTRMEATY